MKVFITTILLTYMCNINFAVVGSLKPNDIRHHLGSRTPYRFKSNKNDSRIKYTSKLKKAY